MEPVYFCERVRLIHRTAQYHNPEDHEVNICRNENPRVWVTLSTINITPMPVLGLAIITPSTRF
jgi:hypothetical protein